MKADEKWLGDQEKWVRKLEKEDLVVRAHSYLESRLKALGKPINGRVSEASSSKLQTTAGQKLYARLGELRGTLWEAEIRVLKDTVRQYRANDKRRTGSSVIKRLEVEKSVARKLEGMATNVGVSQAKLVSLLIEKEHELAADESVTLKESRKAIEVRNGKLKERARELKNLEMSLQRRKEEIQKDQEALESMEREIARREQALGGPSQG